MGRTAQSEDGVDFFWSASGFEANANGSELWAQIQSDYDKFEVWISVWLNGVQTARLMLNKGTNDVCLYRNLPSANVKNIRVYKETQAMGDDDKHRFLLKSLSTDGDLLPVTPQPLRIEFIGDSITSGEGTVGAKGETDWTSIFFGATKTWAIKLASSLGADFNVISQSGWGVVCGYDSNLGDVRYAYLSSYGASYSESTGSCIVDAKGIVGTNITLDVAMNGTGATANAVPYIGYYGDSGPKMAYLNVDAIPSTVTTTAGKAGAISDKFTGYWEVTEIPTSSNAPKDRVSVGVWKDKDTGVIKVSTPVGKTAKEPSGTTTTATNGITVGNGTINPVVGYEIRPTSAEGYMETAQKK